MSKFTIKGIFLKKEVDNKNYHFILPEVYNRDFNNPSHTSNILNGFDKTEKEKYEKKLDKSTLHDTNIVILRNPLYAGHFKAKMNINTKLIVGLEYQMVVYLNSYSFTDSDDKTKQINGWYIQIISIKEITEI